MSTRSGIGILMSSNRIKGIYCHYDGYLDGGVGEILFKYFHDGAEAEELIDMGDRSYIHEDDFNEGVYTDEGYTYDRVKPRIYTYDKFAQFQAYNYVWVDEADAWYVSCSKTGYQFVSLRNALKGDYYKPINLDDILNSEPKVSGGLNPSSEEVENFFMDASTKVNKKSITARTIDRWNPKIRDYEPIDVPDDWKVTTYADMDEEVNCVNCGKPLSFGETYTSRHYYDKYGFGYAECEDCYEQQFKNELGTSPIESSTAITAADEPDDFEDPRIDEASELQDRVEDDFDYVIAGIERLVRLGQVDEAINLLNTLSDTLNSAVNIIGNDFESGSDIGEDDVLEEL